MNIYIRSVRDYSLLTGALRVSEASLCLDNDNDSSVIVIGEYSKMEGELLCVLAPSAAERYVGVISSMAPKDGTTTIKAKPFVNAFARSCSWSGFSLEQCVGERIFTVINQDFRNQADAVYAMPYITFPYQPEGQDDFEPELDEVGMFNLKDFILQMQNEHGIAFQAIPTNSGVALYSYDWSSVAATPIDFGLTRHQLTSETYSSKVVAKITNHTSTTVGDVTTWAETSYYLLADGSYTTDSTAATRISGEWKHVFNKSTDDIAGEFAKNEFQHSIKFYSTERIEARRPVRLRMPDGRIIRSTITGVKISTEDDRVEYTAGTLATTLTDIVRRLTP